MIADPTEQVEQIPWSELLAEEQRSRPWLGYVAVALVAALALGFIVSQLFGRSTEPEAAAVSTAAVNPASTVVLPSPAIYSEADLLAALPDQEAAAAVSRAEWFVTDYFTVDGEADRSVQVDAGLAEVPAADPTGAGVSYVEWARAVRAEPLGDHRFRVTVAFRTLSGEGTYTRNPVRAVAVTIATDSAGGTIVEDLPSPAQLPPPPQGAESGLALAETQLSAAAEQSALAEATGWGADPRIVAANESAGRQRVVIEVTDASGWRWPLVIWMTGDGLVLPGPPA